MRSIIVAASAIVACVLCAAPCLAQGFGLGGRMTLVRGDVDADTGSERFFGGLLKFPISQRSAIEVSLDRRTESNDALTERIVETPLQGTLLLYLTRSRLAPYVLGGVGWYARRVEDLTDGEVTASETSRRFGYHAGIGGELRLGRHAGVHADYRYTFLKFGGDDDEDESLLGRFKPSFEGSMWTAGLTLYF
jgi:opacity protein-like surface antigen